MNTTISMQQVIKELKAMPEVYNLTTICASLTDRTIIGVNVYASSLIRKHAHTAEVIQKFCRLHGFTMVDTPLTTHIAIYF